MMLYALGIDDTRIIKKQVWSYFLKNLFYEFALIFGDFYNVSEILNNTCIHVCIYLSSYVLFCDLLMSTNKSTYVKKKKNIIFVFHVLSLCEIVIL